MPGASIAVPSRLAGVVVVAFASAAAVVLWRRLHGKGWARLGFGCAVLFVAAWLAASAGRGTIVG